MTDDEEALDRESPVIGRPDAQVVSRRRLACTASVVRYLAFVISWSVLAGCSLIYNPNNLPSPPGEAG